MTAPRQYCSADLYTVMMKLMAHSQLVCNALVKPFGDAVINLAIRPGVDGKLTVDDKRVISFGCPSV